MRVTSAAAALLPLFSLALAWSRHDAAVPRAVDADVAAEVANVVHFDLVISEGLVSPDGGRERMAFLMNGKFPGDQLAIDEGDEVEFVVHNSASEGLTVHFHGIEQKNTPWSDGVPGVTQLLIEPGEEFTYRFKAEQFGFYHAHAHSKSMQDDGLVMPIYIRPSPSRDRPFSQISTDPTDLDDMLAAEQNAYPFLISDWRHRTSDEMRQIWLDANIEPLCAQSILINGQGSVVCPTADELSAMGAARGFGDLTEQGCLSVDNPVINGYLDESNPGLVPEELYRTCSDQGVDNPLHTVRIDNSQTRWAMFNFVNSGGLWGEKVSIDEHPMWIVAVEGEYVDVTEPVNAVSLAPGVRVQAMINLGGQPGDAYTIRVSANVLPQVLTGYAILEYASEDTTPTLVKPADGYPALPTSTPSMDYTSGLINDGTEFSFQSAGAFPFPPNPPPSNDEVTQTIFFDMSQPNATSWAANGTGLPFEVYEETDPLIWEDVWMGVQEAVVQGQGEFVDSPLLMAHSVAVIPTLGSVVDLVFVVKGNGPPHPIHKHFNPFWVIGEGKGAFEWNTVAEAYEASPESFNLVNPPRRDGYNTPPASADAGGSWLALRYIVENAGPQTIHCHISQHATHGMLAILLQAMDQMDVPPEYERP